LQIYTPPKTNAVAIEPTTGIANSLNSGEGINILAPGEFFDVTWSVALEMKNPK
jgi:aldose 1-epimerase